MFCLGKTERKQLEHQRCVGCLGDNMGQRRPSTYSAHEFSCYGKIQSGNSWENQWPKGIACILDTNIHRGSNRNLSELNPRDFKLTDENGCKTVVETLCCCLELVWIKLAFGFFLTIWQFIGLDLIFIIFRILLESYWLTGPLNSNECSIQGPEATLHWRRSQEAFGTIPQMLKGNQVSIDWF